MTTGRDRFSIGIDLGTTNSALAFVPLAEEAAPEIMLIPQWESLAGLAEQPTLPSFLYLPDDAVAAHFRNRAAGDGQWIIGRLARAKAGETPGRVVHSAKSWLCHHAAAELRSLTNGLPSRTNVCTRRKRTCGPQGGSPGLTH